MRNVVPQKEPWRPDPLTVSLLDVKRYTFEELRRLKRAKINLTRLAKAIIGSQEPPENLMDRESSSSSEAEDDKTPVSAKEKLRMEITWLMGKFEDFGMDTEITVIGGVVDVIERAEPWNEIEKEIHALDRIICIHLGKTEFLYQTPSDLALYDELEPFGKSVAENFPSAKHDITEAAKCFALERYTATVTHCARVLEVGLKALAQRLHVKFDEQSWLRLLNDLRGEWNAIESGRNQPKNWKSMRQFYNDAFMEFTHIKDAWRNYAAHAKTTYERDDADLIMRHTKSLMKKLSKRIKERAKG
jgi:hypothetical protein